MAKGIVNPFFDKPPTPKRDPSKIPIKQKGSRDLEAPLPVLKRKSKIDLDGDSYIVRIWDAPDIAAVVQRLGQLLYAVKEDFESDLKEAGVYFELTPRTWTLRTPSGEFYVHVPEEGDEVDVYRRLGYALSGLRKSAQDVLQKHGVQIIQRG